MITVEALTLEERIDHLLARVRAGWDYLTACAERGDLATYAKHVAGWEKLVDQLADADDERRAGLGLPVFASARNLSRGRAVLPAGSAVETWERGEGK